MINYFFFITLKTIPLFDEIFWNLQDYYIATWCFAQYYYSLVLRTFGILLLTVYRYITMCQEGSFLEHIMNSKSRWVLVVLHWFLPSAYILPLLCRQNVLFNDPKELDVLADKELISLANILSISFVVPAFTVCIFCYAAIIKFILDLRRNFNGSLRRERHVCIQMMGVFIAFALVMVYHILQYQFSLESNMGPVIEMRKLYILVSSFLSYVTPMMMVITMKDLRRKLNIMYGQRKKRAFVSSVAAVSTQNAVHSFVKRSTRKD
ncbi:hypothetical protein OESDEN_07615 [Oesophagostomum dentatum]|uniref:G-protein coupled receptors family 1 profile domain-containing protein n=1 Tax=Oesophagostomum dentatum TaxID=61180 RepID=A0A0B1TAV5_OESDE|nr:hypothetical protein OESDEN_07615 [Oesophagostomum dentatum]